MNLHRGITKTSQVLEGARGMNTNFANELHRRATHAMQTGLADADTQGGQVAVSQYISDEQTTQELRLLRQFPQPVAGSSSIPTPGAWLSLTPFDVPLLLVRQSDGAVHAFLNVCRHRGARVVAEGSGTEARAFICPYHAWTYQPDGDLRGVPDSFGFPA
jgi:phenylpropionate dioxygenase-like ring-hydroxylating dioxygenase large terminal subunit